MTLRTWKGPSGTTSLPRSGNWNRSSNWSPSGIPVANDDVVLGGTGTYTLTLNISATPTLGSLTINDASATLAIGSATLNVTGTSSTGPSGAITVTAGHITIAGGKINDAGGMALTSLSSSLSGWGSVAGSLSDNGTLSGGTVTASGGTLDLTGPVTGLQLFIATAAGSDLKIDGTATSGAIAINSASQTLEIGAAGSLTIGAAETVSAGHIQLDGGSLVDTSGLVLTGATLSGKGTVSAAVSGAGTITASGGLLEFKNAVDGSGPASSFQIAAGAHLQFDSSVGATGINPIVTFNGATGELGLGSNLAAFYGRIANFAAGDAITVAGATGVQLADSTDLNVYNGSNLLGTLTFTSSYAGDTFSVSNGTIMVSAPAPPTVAVSNVINGPSDSNNATLNGFNAIPPDNALAVSANDVLMAENDVIEITNRSGTVLLSPEALSTFFSSVDHGYSLTDPRALVDPATGKFIVTCDALTTNSSGAVTGSAVLYAISNSTDPTGSWTFGNVNTTYLINNVATWADQPTIASNGSYLDVTSAQFGVSSGQYVDNAVTIIPLSGGASPLAYNLGNAADYRPVAVPGGDYFVGYTGNALSILFNGNGSSTFTSASISLGPIDVGNGAYTAAQKGSSVLLDAGDDAVANAVYANGYIYAVFEVIPPGSTQPAAHWVKIAVSNNSNSLSLSVAAQGNITGPGGAAAFNPSIAVDGNGDVLVNFTSSSSTMYPGAFAAVMPAGSSSFLAPVQYGSSIAPEAATFGVTNNVIRWGDYSTAVADPSAGNGFVVSNEVVPSAQNLFNNAPWATVTADITVSGGSSAAVVTASLTSTATSSNTASANLSPLTAATDTEHHWIGGPATVASLDAANLPSFGPVLGGGSSGFDGDPHSPASLGLLVDYMASAFADRSVGLMGTPIGNDPATATTPHLLTTPHHS
jgi:hypothetical protein